MISSNLVSFAPGQPTGNNLTAASPTSTPTATTPSPAASPTVAATPTPSAPNPTAAAPPRSVDSRVTPPPTTSTPSTTAATPSPAASPAVNTPTRPEATAVVVQPIPPVGSPQKSEVPALARPLNATERSYAQGAWNYFNANYQSNTGLVNDRSDVKGVTPWGIGDYLAALNAARSLGIISAEEFDQRTRLLLGALTKLPLFSNELPSRSYDTRTLQPIDYGGNLVAEGTGWSSLDIGRLLASLYSLKSSYPQYTDAVDQILLNWSYLRVVRAGRLSSAIATNDDQERQRGTNTSTRFTPETRLGYEEYAARAFQLWGFEVDRSAVGGDYQKVAVEGVQVPLRRIRADVKTDGNQFTVSNPFLLYGLEFGFDPQMRSLFEPIRRAEAERYRRTGKLTASATTVIDREPYVVHSTVIAGNEPWATLGDDGKSVPDARIVSTANAFAYQAMFPEDSYAQKLSQATASLFNPSQGYYEGFYEQTGKPTAAFTSSTNSIILQSLLYRVTNQQPVVRATPDTNSPWWRAVAAGDTAGRGLPITATQKARVIADVSGTYWASVSENPSGGNIARGTTPTAPSTAAETTVKPPQPTPTQTPVQEFVAPVASSSPRQETPPPRTTPLPTPPV
ncbi:MAG: DUF3131 domain-containing protein, partial [Aphanothece sp. CMT-3BRIN-NPC111]|nr:DUF3131 domain-containing protein [Aphanothece sp. CMT-3BRIN-NPC111]